MKKFKKIVFCSAIIFIALWLTMPLVRMLLGLEFADDYFKSDYREFLFYAVPIAIMLSLFGTIRSIDGTYKIVSKVIGTISIAMVAICIMFLSIFTDMCLWTNGQVLFENKNKPNIKIMERDFGCGATDSGPPVEGIFKVQYFTAYFIRSTKIDTAKIKKDEWLKIH